VDWKPPAGGDKTLGGRVRAHCAAQHRGSALGVLGSGG
jgi:hypothetical protein